MPSHIQVLIGLIAVLVVCLNVLAIVLYRAATKRMGAETDKIAKLVASGVDSGPMLNEVRDFYEFTSAELQRLLNEAHREGNRQKQDRFRKLIDRLRALKARTLDRSAKLLDGGQSGSSHSSRRRRRPRRPSGSGRPDSSKGKGEGEAKPSTSSGP